MFLSFACEERRGIARALTANGDFGVTANPWVKQCLEDIRSLALVSGVETFRDVWDGSLYILFRGQQTRGTLCAVAPS